MLPMSFEDVMFAALEESLPDVRVLPAAINVPTLTPDTGTEFPVLIVDVSAREVETMQTGWETQQEAVWELDLSLTLLDETEQVGQCMLDVHQAVKELEYASMTDDAGEAIASFGRINTTAFFTSTGTAPLSGGKSVSQKSGTYSTTIREL